MLLFVLFPFVIGSVVKDKCWVLIVMFALLLRMSPLCTAFSLNSISLHGLSVPFILITNISEESGFFYVLFLVGEC